MNKNTKIVLIIVSILVALCICTCIAMGIGSVILGKGIDQAVTTDPTEAAALAQEIATYDLPPGYEQNGFGFFGFNTIIIIPKGFSDGSAMYDSGLFIMLMQFPSSAELNEDQMEKQMEQAMEQQYSQKSMEITSIETQKITIRGEERLATISEGTTQQGQDFRQLFVFFEGNNGTAALMIMGTLYEWDEKLIDNFIASFR